MADQQDEQEGHMMSTLRPQIFMSILVLGAISLYALKSGHIEVVTASAGGILALGLKVLERE